MIDFSNKRWFIFMSFVLVVSGAWIWLSAASPADLGTNSITAPQKGLPPPAFHLDSLTGEEYHFPSPKKQVILINFWASWCPPCRAEMPAMQRVYQKYQGSNFEILAVNVTNKDRLEDAAAIVEENGLTFPVLLDHQGRVSEEYRVNSMPTSFFIDKQGIVQYMVIGGPMREALILSYLQELLEE